MRYHACLVLAAALAVLGVLPVAAVDRALLIGVNDYQDPDINDLSGPSHDVENVRRLLVEEFAYPANSIKLLTESQATRKAVFDAIETWLIDGTQAGDRIYLYFSGHGAQVEIPDGNGGSYITTGLVPYDADNTVSQSATTAGGLILGSQLGEVIRRMTGRDVTIVVDACHSGSLTRDPEAVTVPANIRTITPNGPADLDPADITDDLVATARSGLRLLDFNAKDGTPIEGVAVWSAATVSQYSWDSATGGIFTDAFVNGLRERSAAFSGDGRVSASSLLAFVRDKTDAFCAGNPTCLERGFTPELLSPDTYLASILVPYVAGGASLVEPVVEPEQETDEPEVSAPPLVDLAEGVFSHQNDFGLDAAILPSNRLKLGDKVRFRINAEQTGRLVVLDSGPDGELRRIFPNQYSEAVQRDGIVEAGQGLTIPDESYPFEFTATDPGPGSLVVLVTEPDVDIQALFQSGDFEAIDDVGKALVAIAAELQEPVLTSEPDIANRARRWAFVTVPYTVSE